MIVLVLPWNQQSTKTLIMAATGDVIGLAAMSAIDVCSDGNITNSLMSDLVAYRISNQHFTPWIHACCQSALVTSLFRKGSECNFIRKNEVSEITSRSVASP